MDIYAALCAILLIALPICTVEAYWIGKASKLLTNFPARKDDSHHTERPEDPAH